MLLLPLTSLQAIDQVGYNVVNESEGSQGPKLSLGT